VRDARRRLRRDPCVSVPQLARELACTERTLNRAFALTGSTVRAERSRVRLDHAASVLLAGMPIAVAARRAGYASSRQLAAPFRRRFGVTPSRMRQVGSAVRTVTWQAKQRGPYRGSWQQRQRRITWRACRRTLLAARNELVAGTLPADKVQSALNLRLSRPRKSPVPLSVYEVFGVAPGWISEDLLREHPMYRRAA